MPKGVKKGGGDGSVPPLPPNLIAPPSANALRARLEKNFDKNTVPDPSKVQIFEVASSGSLCLDHILGVGGYARGRITTFSGPQHAGKTLLACLGIASIQRLIWERENRKANVVIIDAEQAFSNSLGELAGCDLDPANWILTRPDSIERALELAMQALGMESKDKGRTWQRVAAAADVILFDSWAGAATEGVGLSERARIGSEWMPTVNVNVNRGNAWMFFCNHMREKPGMLMGDPRYEPGGEAFQNMRSVALWGSKVEQEYDSRKEPIAHTLRVVVKKNKLAQGVNRKTDIRIDYAVGVDRVKDAFELFALKRVNLKEGTGTIYACTLNGILIRENGEKNFLDMIRRDPALTDCFIAAAVNAQG